VEIGRPPTVEQLRAHRDASRLGARKLVRGHRSRLDDGRARTSCSERDGAGRLLRLDRPAPPRPGDDA
jgi:hypothetical protein